MAERREYYQIFDKESAKERLARRVALYCKDIRRYKRSAYNEMQVRIDFVNPFFKSLGWDVDNEAGLPQHMREVTHEATVLVEEEGKRKAKRPDYSFKTGTEILFYLETKKPSVDITTDRLPAFQLRRYGWSGNLKISVLSNFNDLYIYDCTVRPVENDDVSVALIAHYSYTEYIDKFDEIYDLLSKEAVLSGGFEQKFKNIRETFRREPFDEYFLRQIKSWRNLIGKDIAERHKSIDIDTLNICVQRILNRIIFLRICEDRNLEKYETLKQIMTYHDLKKLFISADKKYDSGLFELLEEDSYTVSDHIMIQIFQSLYYPNNSYEFSVVDPYIIGQIYELFLGESLYINDDGTIATIEKPEAVDSQGAVNTPKNITDIIVEQTLSLLYDGKRPADVRDYRIADICCGAGNFLLSTYEYIVNYYIEYFKQYELEEAVNRGDLYQMPGGSDYCLSYALRREILVRNIFGVDIDPLAVEVTKFSLSLKVLEGASSDELEAYSDTTSNKILPNLELNIKNGNSLVDSTFSQYEADIYSDLSLMNKIRMFDWDKEFPHAGFHAIVGNPPYIRVQNMVHYSPEEYEFYKSSIAGYSAAHTDLMDKYYLFLEKGLSLLTEDGVLGYIIPHKFMTIKSGKELRGLLANHRYVRKIYHFGTFQAFKARSTYTCIILLSKKPQDNFEIAFIQDWNRFLFEHGAVCDTYPAAYLSEQPWTFLPKSVESALEQIKSRCVPLKSIAEIFVGVQTSADKIYVVQAEEEDEQTITFTGQDNVRRKIERGILRKCVYDAKLLKYNRIEANSYIIFPYRNVEGKSVLIKRTELKQMYPLTYSYLCEFRDELDRRNMPNRTDDNWYGYGRSQSIRRFTGGEHLIWPVLSLDSNYVYDNEMVVFTGGGNGPFYGLALKKGIKESVFYIQAVLNHRIMELLVKNKASMFRGGYYSHGKQYIAELPVYKIDFTDEGDRRVHENIVSHVKMIMELSQKKAQAGNHAEGKVLQRAIEVRQQELDRLIEGIYGVEVPKAEE